MEAVCLNIIEFALREQSTVEEVVKYISVLSSVSGIRVTPRVQIASSLISSGAFQNFIFNEQNK